MNISAVLNSVSTTVPQTQSCMVRPTAISSHEVLDTSAGSQYQQRLRSLLTTIVVSFINKMILSLWTFKKKKTCLNM